MDSHVPMCMCVCQLIELLHSIVESFIRLILFFCVQHQNLSCFEDQSMLNVFFSIEIDLLLLLLLLLLFNVHVLFQIMI